MKEMTMSDVIMALVEEGLEKHSLTDKGCKCDSYVDHYGPEGTPGRCRSCYDAQQGEECDDALRYAAIRDALNAPPSGNTCEPGCVRSSLHQGDCEDTPPPDPLDENDHRDRIDRNGSRWTYRNPGVMPWCVEWCHCVGAWDLRSIDRNSGPLRFEVVALDDEVL